eukprot:NODE_79_length_23048_cov_0.747614.p10 type:complete len:247 gc:universal NODE_79_length_23048_cov_0.747614:8612-7872(-)
MTRQCKECQKVFDHLGHYNEHLLVHSEERLHECQICKKTFKRLAHLNDHNKVHEPKEFKCHCGKEFTYKSNLNQHMKRHDKSKKMVVKKEKKSKLVVCGICFIKIPIEQMEDHIQSEHPTEQIIHEAKHVKKRIFSCPYDLCEKTFVSNYNLNSHIEAIHFQIKKHHCSVCDKNFGFKSALIRHQKLHKGNLQVKCPFCMQSYKKLSNLTEHIDDTHGSKSKLGGEDLLMQWYGVVDDSEELIEIC